MNSPQTKHPSWGTSELPKHSLVMHWGPTGGPLHQPRTPTKWRIRSASSLGFFAMGPGQLPMMFQWSAIHWVMAWEQISSSCDTFESGNIYKYKRLLKLHWKVACGHCRRLSCWTNTTKNTVQPAPFFLLSLRPASKHLKIFTSCCQQPPVKEQGGPWCQVKFQGFDLCSEVQRIEGMLLVCGQRKATNLCVKMNFMLFIHLDTKSQGWKGW